MGMPELEIYSMIGAEGFARLVAAFYTVRNFNKTDNKFSEMQGNGKHGDRANRCWLY